MNKNLLKTVIILLAVTFVTLQSCEKKALIDDENMNIQEQDVKIEKSANLSDIEFIEGMLVFESIEEYEALMENNAQLTVEDMRNWQQEIGFISQQSILEQALKEEDKYYEQFDPTTMTEEEIAKVVKEKEALGYTEFTKKYIDMGIIKPYINEDMSSLELSVVSWINAGFLNIDGMVMVDNIIYQFTATQCKKLTTGDFSKIGLLKQTYEDNKSQNIVIGNLFENTKDYHARLKYDYKEGNRRKIEAEVWLRRWDYSSSKQYLYYLRYRNYKKNIWGKWKEDSKADTDITGGVTAKISGGNPSYYSINYSRDNRWADNPHVCNLYSVPKNKTVTFSGASFYFKRDNVSGITLNPNNITK